MAMSGVNECWSSKSSAMYGTFQWPLLLIEGSIPWTFRMITFDVAVCTSCFGRQLAGGVLTLLLLLVGSLVPVAFGWEQHFGLSELDVDTGCGSAAISVAVVVLLVWRYFP